MIKYRLLTPKCKDVVLKFLRKHYYPDEPLEIARSPPGHCIQDEFYQLSYLENTPSSSYAAFKGDQLVGIGLGFPKGPDEEQLILNEAAQFPGTKWAQILAIAATLEREANVFEKLKVNKVFRGSVLAVHKDFRKGGIGRELFHITVERAKELGYPAFDCCCTNSNSALIAQELGFECIHELRFEDYREPGNDKQVLFPPKGHEVMRTYAKLLV